MSKSKVILIGGGGHCKVVISMLKKLNTFELYGISDEKENLGRSILGVDINTTDDDLEEIFRAGVQKCFITIGSIGSSYFRRMLFEKVKSIGFEIPIIISKDSIVSKDVEIQEGTAIMPGAIVNPGVRIGKNCIVNTGAIIEHDCTVGDNVHIAPGVTISGGVGIGNNTHIGTGASIIQGVNIGSNVLIGAGSVVVNDISDNIKAFGVPAKKISDIVE